ncbi:MAG: glycosyltransferase [Chloroflexi bacterium]|nr:glycosyltransferase [Chloroflexota bacterium]
MTTSLTVLYDGWPLVYAPDSPAALHLLGLLERLPQGVRGLAALPAPSPAWLPENLEPVLAPTPPTPSGRLVWMQRALPRLKRQTGAGLLHTTRSGAPLSGGGPFIVSPSGFGRAERRAPGAVSRLADALAAGGLSRAAAILWPDDQSPPDSGERVLRLPFAAPSAFHPPAPDQRPPFDLPEGCILWHGPSTPQVLGLVLSAWSWAHNPIGADFPLVLLGLDAYGRAYAGHILAREGLADTVRILPPVAPAEAAALYRHCAALFHPHAPGAWGGPVRLALACGVPVVSSDRPDVAEVVGPAGFLIKENDARHLGGGLIAVIVKENVRMELEEKAAARAAAWDAAAFTEALGAAYRAIVE